ncbi:Oxidoreductase [Heterostelium album PN500]|uniref:Oxidoreductase n=1 Tax=Heterostelium pallidum (strain ATCC 26659 / Pp 5 / PN500) TaxID=670386 RepID=D3BQQ0_HETP5|nr:Oxidoreductase [Heterostelium album PN500]EFA76470.1 Oxidoreductase [Heterostelium album PN500]|eukprot:XP_020428602.1 Oxidoreductase [Heterostelium album PN500]
MSNSQQRNTIVLITGTSSGIGASLVHSIAKYPNIKVYASARNLSSIKHLKDKNISTIQLDVCDNSSIKSAVDTIINEEGRIDILINNAGINIYGPVIDIPEVDNRRLFDANFFGTIAVTQEVGRHMIERRSGLIANISSISGLITTPFDGLYCASKAALNAWSDSLRMELAPFNIRVCIVMPGSIKTELANNAKSTLEQLLDNTVYHDIKDSIVLRSTTSQDNSIPSTQFSERVAAELLKSNPPSRFAYGPLSTLFKLLNFVPTFILDYVFSKKFGLLKLKSLIEKSTQNTTKQ